MNAQEAMKYIDREIRRLSEGIEYKVPSEREMIEDEIECLSILLASARLLHELLKSVRVEVPYERATHLPNIELDSQGYSNDFYIVLSEKAYKSIGIEEGADE